MPSTKVIVLATDDITYKNTGLIFPILKYKDKLSEIGYDIDIVFNNPDDVVKCDYLLVSDNVYTNPQNDHDLLDDLSEFGRLSSNVFWVDTTDSTTVQTYTEIAAETRKRIIPNVDGYLKKQILKDKERYLSPMYESRLYSDYYANTSDGFDEHPSDRHVQVTDRSHLDKIGLWWNLGLNPRIPFVGSIEEYFPKLAGKSERLGCLVALNTPTNSPQIWADFDCPRPNSVSGRFGTSFDSGAIEHHRKLMESRLDGQFENNKVSPRRYWKELRNSKVLLSPFGWGEICHRDFEGFMSGCIVVKPRMDHLVTWPPFFEESETIVTVDWSMDDLDRQVDEILDNHDEYRSIARRGQSNFKKYYCSDHAADEFVSRFSDMLESR